MKTLSLDGTWELVERPLADDVDAAAAVAEAPATCPAEVPGDVNDAIFRSGRLPDPLVGRHARLYASWVPERSWWYRRRFAVPADAAGAASLELSLDGLDVHADVWLNGVHLGHHASAFLPFVREVKPHVRAGGENLLLVRLTTGRERVAHRTDFPLLGAVPTEAPRGYPDRGFPQRVFLRKPAYTWGWDWSPHLPTCGITGACRLRCAGVHAIRAVFLRATLEGRVARVRAEVEVERHTLTSTAWGRLRLELRDEEGRTHAAEAGEVLLRSGVTIVPLELEIRAPRLWWPNGAGPQHRYTVSARLETAEGAAEAEPFRWGLRTVALETAPGLFRFRVNGEPLFIQGGNWVPCDHLYGRVAPARLERLVDEAAEAGFNCLRVWGGGRFEPDAFYEACDRRGVLLWHDFMSACAPLPAEEPGFAETFLDEARHQVRRLHNRASLLLWCGNNEVGGCYEWFRDRFAQHRDPAWPLYFERLPRVVRAHAPHLPYWPTSPYGGPTVGDATVGDDHHWVVMRKEPEFWSHPDYWDAPGRSIFNSEYGYGGPCCLESTRAYLGTDAPDLFSEDGREHTNTFYDVPRINFSIGEHYRDPAGLPLEDYILLGGLCQGLNLGYSLESLRANERTWGAIFWMYDDAWGENGWTIVDYYLRRKIAYYGVKRALAPRHLAWRRGGQAFGGAPDEVLLIALNSGPRAWRGRVAAGYLSWDGARRDLGAVDFAVPPRAKAVVARRPVPPDEDRRRGTLVAIPAGPGAAPAAWRHGRFRDLGLPPARVRVVRARAEGPDLLATVAADAWAHAVHFGLGADWRLDDGYFDLPPGVRRTVRILGGAALDPRALRPRCVNAPPGGCPPAGARSASSERGRPSATRSSRRPRA